MFHPRNAADALVRAGFDKDAKVHLHIDEVCEDLERLKREWQLELLRRIARQGEEEAFWISDNGAGSFDISAPYDHRSRPHLPLSIIEDEIERLLHQTKGDGS